MGFNHERNLSTMSAWLKDDEKQVASIPGFFQFDFPDGENLDNEVSLLVTTSRVIAYRKRMLGEWRAEALIGQIRNMSMMHLLMRTSGLEIPLKVIMLVFHKGESRKNWSLKLASVGEQEGRSFLSAVYGTYPEMDYDARGDSADEIEK